MCVCTSQQTISCTRVRTRTGVLHACSVWFTHTHTHTRAMWSSRVMHERGWFISTSYACDVCTLYVRVQAQDINIILPSSKCASTKTHTQLLLVRTQQYTHAITHPSLAPRRLEHPQANARIVCVCVSIIWIHDRAPGIATKPKGARPSSLALHKHTINITIASSSVVVNAARAIRGISAFSIIYPRVKPVSSITKGNDPEKNVPQV